ncbi:MAG TPA: bifunctional hydroxymethylpyrimidine kinase/phosphomethylpyrimidine kinase [Verrucomicrobia bacterium]|nr:MAG: bifunctional hydroxymethylpyrimidine kinase/phosphomethylpyrimidine kinase [Lentisphaerae bacterium GWF2_57_35]HBA85108.1 bifunctional hydroxymethylpyrimidine kinase/phosphomethylpyrimidine kinase [Verrucomicrobiota bacterium]
MKPIVWTIAGTDPGGGAGIQGDLKTMNSLGVHGCSVITALIAQNTLGVKRCDYVAEDMIQAQLEVLTEDLPPAAIKIGMLGSVATILYVAENLRRQPCPIVYDPVMISSSGHRLMEPDALAVLKNELLPQVSLLTPNIPEAEQLLERTIRSGDQVEQAARDLLKLGPGAVLLKGGHANSDLCSDYWTNGREGCWISSPRRNVTHTHGTGCTLSSAIASCRALGYGESDSLVIGKAYVNQGLRRGGGIGHGHGPLAHEGWPTRPEDLPWITGERPASLNRLSFPSAGPLGLYPLVERAEQIDPLLAHGITVIQLRVKDLAGAALEHEIRTAIEVGRRHPQAAVYINDYWKEALQFGAYGVHLGQTDLDAADLAALQASGLRLGISASSWTDLAKLGRVRPSYIGIGAVFSTGSKAIDYAPLGVDEFRRLRAMTDVPVVAIGGITLERAEALKQAGAEGMAVISDLAATDNPTKRIQDWQAFFAKQI